MQFPAEHASPMQPQCSRSAGAQPEYADRHALRAAIKQGDDSRGSVYGRMASPVAP